MRDARKRNTVKQRPRISSAKGRRLRNAKKRSVNHKCSRMARSKRKPVVQWQQLPVLAPVILLPQTTNGNGASLAPVETAVSSSPAPDRVVSRRMRKKAKRSHVAQFRFQPFKKCFNVKCSTVLVPGDFKPCSPRRMFCSQQCFEAHWHEKLYAHGPATERKIPTRPIPTVIAQASKRKNKRHRRRVVARRTSIIQFPANKQEQLCNQGLLRGAAGF